MSKHYTDAEYEAAWHACVKVRDAAPRLPIDADSNDVVRAVLDAVAPLISSRAAAKALREAADDIVAGRVLLIRARAEEIEAGR